MPTVRIISALMARAIPATAEGNWTPVSVRHSESCRSRLFGYGRDYRRLARTVATEKGDEWHGLFQLFWDDAPHRSLPSFTGSDFRNRSRFASGHMDIGTKGGKEFQ